MKKNKIVSIILLFLIILPIVFTSCQSDNRDIPGSFKISDEEWTLLKDAGASAKQNIVKIYHMSPLIYSEPFYESTGDFEECKKNIEAYYLDTDEPKTYVITNNGVVSDEIVPQVATHLMDIYKSTCNIESLFSATKATKNIVSDLEIYEVEIFWHPRLGVIVILRTNRGEFVNLKQLFLNIEMKPDKKEYNNEYLMPMQKYTEVAKALNDIQNPNEIGFIMKPYPDAGELVDLSEYEVKRPNNIIIPIIAVSVVVIGASVAAAVIIKRRKGNKKAEISEEQ